MRHPPAIALLLLSVVLLNFGCAAQRHTNQGRAALLADDPITARHHFNRALEHDPKLARKAEFVEDYRVAQRDAAVVEGHQALRRLVPTEAIPRFEKALELHPGWPPAVEGLAVAHRRAAESAYQQAIRDADAGRLDLAAAALRTALDHAPDHASATAALASLTTPAAEQPALFRQAREHADARDWDAALSAYRQTIAEAPDFLPARAAVPATLDAAARDTLDQSAALLADGRFDDAEAMLQRTGNYRPDHPEIEPALGHIDLARGDADFVQDRPGSALLWFRQARAHFQSAGVSDDLAQQQIALATARLRDRHRLTIRFTPASDDPHDLSSSLINRVQQRLAGRDAAALAFGPTGEPIAVSITQLDLPAYTVHTESLLHPYDVEYDVPNPERPRLEHELRRIEFCIDDLCRREQHLERRHHALHLDHPFGPSCSCAHEVHRVHRELDRVRHELRDARRDLRRVSHRLHAEPFFLTHIRVEHWPYTRATHQRTATLLASFALPDHAPQTFATQLTDADTTISPARPNLGLREDPLDLASDAELQNDLLDQTAHRLAHELASVLVQQRIDQLYEQERALTDSDPEAARESRIAAAVLLAAIDRQASEKQLDAEP